MIHSCYEPSLIVAHQTIISRYQRAALAFLVLLSLVTLVVALSAVGDAALRAEWPRLAGMLACLGFMLGWHG